MNKYGIIAIHGGKIEHGTSEIARALAGDYFPVYINEKPPHIHSSKFDNKEIRKIFQQCEIIISIHGEKNRDDSFVIVGGLNKELAKKIEDSLFKSGFTEKHYSHRLRGLHKNNVCNRGLSKKGVQLEISHKLRDDLLENKNKMKLFIISIRKML